MHTYSSATPRAIRKTLATLYQLLHSEEYVSAFEAADACRLIAKWAGRKGLTVTSLQYAEACAAILPQSPRALNFAARTNRLLGQPSRAEVYYERAINFARHKSQWAQYVRGNLGLGTIRAAQGKVQAAIDYFHAAARAAKSESGERWLAARTAHDLLLLQADLGYFNEAAETAIDCLEWYGVHNPRFPAVVHDIGMLFVRQGRYEIALPLLELVTRANIAPVDQALGWSTYARAVAGGGDKARYMEAMGKALDFITRFPVHGSAVFNNLAFGAQSLGLWEHAEIYAREGAARAVAGTAEARDATKLLSDCTTRTVPQYDSRPLTGYPWDRLFQLLADVPRRMTAWRGPTFTKRHEDGPPPDVEF
ncbi:MAG TPA: tetratricopeptide repeat protein [Longimicrobium sp.]